MDTTLDYRRYSGLRTAYRILFQAGSGLFAFRGPGATSETGFEISDVSSIPDVLENPYGRKSGLSYGLTGQVQRITKSRFIYGVQTGFESLASRVTITRISLEGPPVIGGGTATVRNQFINLYPYAGRRLGTQRISLDITAGVDLGIGLSTHERVQLAGISHSFSINDPNRPMLTVDIRPRLNLTGYYRAFGLSLGYSHGLTNYSHEPFSSAVTRSHMWRVGVVYRIGKRV